MKKAVVTRVMQSYTGDQRRVLDRSHSDSRLDSTGCREVGRHRGLEPGALMT